MKSKFLIDYFTDNLNELITKDNANNPMNINNQQV